MGCLSTSNPKRLETSLFALRLKTLIITRNICFLILVCFMSFHLPNVGLGHSTMILGVPLIWRGLKCQGSSQTVRVSSQF